jgi:hypothetical protein
MAASGPEGVAALPGPLYLDRDAAPLKEDR